MIGWWIYMVKRLISKLGGKTKGCYWGLEICDIGPKFIMMLSDYPAKNVPLSLSAYYRYYYICGSFEILDSVMLLFRLRKPAPFRPLIQ